MDAEGVRRRLREKGVGFTTQKALAEAIGMSPQALNGIMRGKREPTGKLLAFLGLERVVRYRIARR